MREASAIARSVLAERARCTVAGAVLLLGSCPSCNGSPDIHCAKCQAELLELGRAAFFLLAPARESGALARGAG
jgi:hypothetical protein